MDHHLNSQQIERFVRREAAPEERLQISDHLAECAECRQRIQQARTGTPVAAVVPVPPASPTLEPDAEHLSYEEIVDYIEGRSIPALRELAESHIAECAMCRDEVRELRAFRATLSTYPNEELAPQAAPSFADRLRGMFRVPVLRAGLQLSGAAVVGACLMLIVLRNRPTTTPNGGDSAALEQARNAAAQAKKEQEIASAALSQERANLSSTKQQLDSAVRQRDDLQQKIRVATARPKPGEVLTDATGKPALVVPVGAAESDTLIKKSVALPERQIASLNVNRTVMGGHDEPDKVTQIGPLGTFVPSLRPTLRWKAFPKAHTYEVRIIDVATNSTRAHAVLTETRPNQWSVRSAASSAEGAPATLSAAAKGTEWTLPAILTLEPGKTYRWTVTAQDAQGQEIARPSPREEAKFGTLTPEAQKEVAGKEALYADAPLLLGIVYARHGVLPEAEAALKRHLATHPTDATAKQILQQLAKAKK